MISGLRLGFIVSLVVFMFMVIGFVLSNAVPELFIGSRRGLPVSYSVEISVYGSVTNKTDVVCSNATGVSKSVLRTDRVDYGYILRADIRVERDLGFRVTYTVSSVYATAAKGSPPQRMIDRIMDAVNALGGSTVSGNMKKELLVMLARPALVEAVYRGASYKGSETLLGVVVDKVSAAARRETPSETYALRDESGAIVAYGTVSGSVEEAIVYMIYLPLKALIGYDARVYKRSSFTGENVAAGETCRGTIEVTIEEHAAPIKHGLPLSMKRALLDAENGVVVLAGHYFSDPVARRVGRDIVVENNGDDPAGILVVDKNNKTFTTGYAGPHGRAVVRGEGDVLGDRELHALSAAGYGDPYVAVRVFFTVGVLATGVITALVGYMTAIEKEAEESYEEELREKRRRYEES